MMGCWTPRSPSRSPRLGRFYKSQLMILNQSIDEKAATRKERADEVRSRGPAQGGPWQPVHVAFSTGPVASSRGHYFSYLGTAVCWRRFKEDSW